MITKEIDVTGRRLFTELLRQGRAMKQMGVTYFVLKSVLLGMYLVMSGHREDFQIADNMRDVWKNQQGGSA